MAALAHDTHRTVILILPAVRQVFAMNTAALSIAQSSPQKLAEDYRDALILDRDGSVRRINTIEILGPAGISGIRRMISSLVTRSKRIAVTLSEPLTVPLRELKAMLIEAITHGGYFIDEDADEAERQRISTVIQSAPDAAALFRTFTLPAPEDALDML